MALEILCIWQAAPDSPKPRTGAILRKLIVLADALLKAYRNWQPKAV